MKLISATSLFFHLPGSVKLLIAHIDIADWLIAYCHPERSEGSPAAGRHSRPDRESHCIAFLKAAQFLSPESHAVVEELIDDLGLVFIRAEKVEEGEEDLSP